MVRSVPAQSAARVDIHKVITSGNNAGCDW